MTVVEVQETEPVTLAPRVMPGGPPAVIELMKIALDKGVPVEALEKLQAMYERAADRAAATEFAEALARFQAKCPPIGKTAKANIVSKSGTKFSYTFAPLDQIARTIAPLLAEAGLTYTWDSDADGKLVKCTCLLRHVNGHIVSAHFVCPVESASAATEQQKYAAALTYARRQSLIQVLGLSTCEPDTDGADMTPISEEQAHELEDLLRETGGNLAKFLKWAGVMSLTDIPQRNYGAAIKVIDAMAKERAAKGGAS